MIIPLSDGLPGLGGNPRVFISWTELFCPIHIEIEPEIEKVLVMRCDDVGRNQVAGRWSSIMLGRLRFRHTSGQHDPTQRRVHFKRSVLVENPIDGVVVVADCRNEEDHKLARPPGFIPFGIEIVVLPEKSAVAFVDTNRPIEAVGLPSSFAKVASRSVAPSGASVC